MPDRLTHLLDRRRVILCMGGGGVGKTTTAAALAVAAALRGRNTAVLTIDPARRLKDALRIPELATRPSPVPLEHVARPLPGGQLTAMMLDAKRTFDDLIARFAPSLDVADQILENRLYQYVSGRLAGSQEYMALEKLYEIATGGAYDLLVVDTPPTHHALDFLDAPQRMIDLLASRALSYLRRPQLAIFSVGSRVAQAALETMLRALERFTGLSILRELADFVSSFEGMLEGFDERARAVRRLLRDPGTAALLVTSAEPFTVSASLSFHQELRRAGLDPAGIVLNRVVPEELLHPRESPAQTGGLLMELPGEMLSTLHQARREIEALADRDRRMFATIRGVVGNATPIVTVPDLVDEVSSLEGLVAIAERLVPGVRPEPSNVTSLPSRAG